MKTLEKSLADAITSIKRNYGGTFIKVELEANLDRGSYDDYTDTVTCSVCSGEGEVWCECEIATRIDNCDECENRGRLTCDNCHGEGEIETSGDNGDEYSNGACANFIMDNVSDACKKATVFSMFLNDGSVDSEFTFTIPIDKPQFAIEYIEAFKALSDEIGNGMDVSGAGMHITILRSPTGNFPRDNGALDMRKFRNFKRSMTKLMPALILLASPDHKSRRLLMFRRPQVGRGDHDSAIDIAAHGDSGVFEWRVFETCYNRPEMFYDYICVIAKGLRFYKNKPPKCEVGVGELTIYDDGGQYGLHKYFTSEKHLKALHIGLDYLKPDHRTKQECLAIRNFKVTPEALERKKMRIEWKVEGQYGEYIKRREKDLENQVKEHRRINALEHEMSTGKKPTQDDIKKAETGFRRRFAKHYPKSKLAYMKIEVEKQFLQGSKMKVKC